MNYKIKCLMCNQDFNTNGKNNLKQHLKENHKKNYQDYYDEFIKKENEDLCKRCGSKTRFKNIFDGYSQFCSSKCNTLNNFDTFKEKNKIENASQLKEIQEKRKKTYQKKYGVNGVLGILVKENKHPSKFLKYKKYLTFFQENIYPSFTFDDYFGKVNHQKYPFKCLICGNEWFDYVHNGDGNKEPHKQICRNCNPINTFKSAFEDEIELFLKENYDGQINKNDRIILNGYEIDFFLPEKKLAIECDGLYWHCELQGKNKKYHLEKTKNCEKQNIQLIHIFENEWKNKQEIVKSILLNKLNKSKTIYARKCDLHLVNNQIAQNFLEKNHIQGKRYSKINIALYFDGNIVSILTFSQSRFNKKYKWEIIRFANKLGYSVIGGFSKMLSFFLKNYRGSIITYADRRFSQGLLYEKNGFSFLENSQPNYFYTKNYDVLFSRQQFQKHKLKEKLEFYDEKLSEWKNMEENKFDRIWDCGNKVYVFENSKQ